MYDLLIKNGTLIDGTGAPRFAADLAVQDGRIARIASEITEPARRVIDARGLMVSPGFIDTRMTQAKELLVMTDLSVGAVAARVGFSSESNFSARFSAMTGQSPLQYRKSIANRS